VFLSAFSFTKAHALEKLLSSQLLSQAEYEMKAADVRFNLGDDYFSSEKSCSIAEP
jgi:hypothetical protein